MPLPNFVIAGERRSGTTSLYAWLRAHPQVYLPETPDINYFIEPELFTRQWRDGEGDAERWEREHSPEQYAALFAAAGGRPASGHKGADLLYWEPAHARIARYVPEARFIVTLRHPVERAWSQYWNEVGKGRETLSFAEALEQEEERCRRSAYARLHLAYLRRGFYARSLAAFFRTLDRRRVHVLILEESRRSPRESLAAVYRFLGVDPEQGLELAGAPRNANATMLLREWAKSPPLRALDRLYVRATEAAIVRLTKDREKRKRARVRWQRLFRSPASERRMSPELRGRLMELYEPHIRELEALLERPLPEWRR